MERKIQRLGVGVMVACALTASSAMAQIVPPPTEAAPATKPYTPQRVEFPAANVNTNRPTVGTPAPKVEIPNVPFESLVKRDANGKVIRLSEPATWAAT